MKTACVAVASFALLLMVMLGPPTSKSVQTAYAQMDSNQASASTYVVGAGTGVANQAAFTGDSNARAMTATSSGSNTAFAYSMLATAGQSGAVANYINNSDQMVTAAGQGLTKTAAFGLDPGGGSFSSNRFVISPIFGSTYNAVAAAFGSDRNTTDAATRSLPTTSDVFFIKVTDVAYDTSPGAPTRRTDDLGSPNTETFSAVTSSTPGSVYNSTSDLATSPLRE